LINITSNEPAKYIVRLIPICGARIKTHLSGCACLAVILNTVLTALVNNFLNI
jgi:hypothetical protein